MKTILISAYAINPFKGSEDGTGWNWINQIARYNKVIAITRENNLPPTRKFMEENPEPHHKNIQLIGFDLPKWARFWKRGGLGVLPYYYLWQRSLPAFIRKQELYFDLAHGFNFHNDWLPTFLWKLEKPTIWGPIGHHPAIPTGFILPVYGWKAWIADQFKWWIKLFFWRYSGQLRQAIEHSQAVLALHSATEEVLHIPEDRFHLLPAIGTHNTTWTPAVQGSTFEILSIGRFVPLKGFDLCLKSFARFYHALNPLKQQGVKLTIVGKGPLAPFLKDMTQQLNVSEVVRFVEWMPNDQLKELYSATDVFLFPSHEGAGMVVPEAFSYGIPVVCLKNCGPGESVTEQSGIRVPYGEYEQTIAGLATGLRRLYDNTELHEQLSLGARRRFENWFDWEVKGQILNEIYELIDEKKDSSRSLAQ